MKQFSGLSTVPWLGLLLLLTAHLPRSTWAEYDATWCDGYAGKGIDSDIKPDFLSDYSVIMTKAVSIDGERPSYLEQQHVVYSDTNRQVMVHETTESSHYFFYVDTKDNVCWFLNSNQSYCTEYAKTCSKAAEKADYVTTVNGQVQLGTSGESMLWPTENIKRKVESAQTILRGIDTTKYIICTYDDANDTTTVSEWFIADFDSSSNTGDKRLLVASEHHTKMEGSHVLNVRRDYSEYEPLSSATIGYGIQVPEYQCKYIQGNYENKTMPMPASRFSFTQMVDTTKGGMEVADRVYEYHEYNSHARMYKVRTYKPAHTIDEVDEYTTFRDYSTGFRYVVDYTKGTCSVDIVLNLLGEPAIISPNEFFGIAPVSQKSFLGRYWVRDILTNLWRLEYAFAEGIMTTVDVYLAPEDWLRKQQLDGTIFYPVLITTNRVGSSEYKRIYEFKDNPGYHIPDLSRCFEESEIFHFQVTILMNYYQQVLPMMEEFKYEFREAILKITGMVSAFRIVRIKTNANNEDDSMTDVYFTILGMQNRLNTTHVNPEKVTSLDAAEQINSQVASGSFTFVLDGKNTTIPFKKKSLVVVDKGVYNPDASKAGSSSKGYSGGSMAGVALALLVVGAAIGTAIVFVYKWWIQSRGDGQIVGMKSLNEDA